MATELTVFEPIPAPDPRRPGMLPSLPQWAERLSAAVRLEPQMTPDGKSFEKQEVLVLPSQMMPSPEQRRAMIDHQDSLRSCLSDVPAHSSQAETRTATAVAKLITVLAGERKSDLADEARSEVYMDVLDDVPCWAVETAVRRWFKHDCGTDERGKAHDYRWAPDPGTLRAVAQQEVHKLGARIGKIQLILNAREYVDCTAQLERGRLAMTGLTRAMKGSPFAASSLTFEQAVALGKQPEVVPSSAASTKEAAE
jgi:hypothetical protein